MRRLLPLAVLLALCSGGLAGCRKDEGPEATYRAFAAAARAGDAATVWSLLSERSRAAFDARAKALAASVPGAPASGKDLVLGDLAGGSPRVQKVVVVRESADEAVVGVTVSGAPDGPPAEVRLVREGGRWRVVTPG
ncbi:MAG: hypothetical protein U0229_23215 [Anaeromyxobacter sp.]